MIEKLRLLAEEYQKLQKDMQDPEVLSDPKKIAVVGKKISDLEPLIELLAQYDTYQASIQFLNETEEGTELYDLAKEEAEEALAKLPELEEEMRAFLIPKDPDDDKSVILEVRAGTGGEEAALFAAEMLRMYIRFAEENKWKIEMMSTTEADAGGLKEASCRIEGPGAYGLLKFESGVHRVQRIPATESKGRIHTSAATIAILPEAEEVDVEINDQDLKIDVYRSSGPGGQSVNTTDSAVRITHEPTGLVVTCQDEKSQHKNKAKALNILRSRLYGLEKERRAKERGDMRAGQVGSGERSEKIRTYNFPPDRVTDHRISQNFNSLPGVMDGNIQSIIDALLQKEREEKLEAIAES